MNPVREPRRHSDTGGPDVSILIVGYNSADLIAACLASIESACRLYSREILLIDNGDGSTERLVARCFPHVAIVPSRGNIGFAAGNNLLAREARGRFLLLLNPDVELLPEAIDRLLDAAVRASAQDVAWGGVTLDRNGKPSLGNSVHAPTLHEMASRVVGRSAARLAPADNLDANRSVEVLSGSFVLIERGAWDAVDGLDERYFLYCEEVDFFYRLARLGKRFNHIAAARAYHDVGHGQSASPMRELYLTTGKVQFARLHWSRPRRLAALLLLWAASLQRYLAGRLLGAAMPRLRPLAERNRLTALRPHWWMHGYDPPSGLSNRLGLPTPSEGSAHRG